jgi:hypothetical protein
LCVVTLQVGGKIRVVVEHDRSVHGDTWNLRTTNVTPTGFDVAAKRTSYTTDTWGVGLDILYRLDILVGADADAFDATAPVVTSVIHAGIGAEAVIMVRVAAN